MIIREYWKSINTTNPIGYFENWYADMWHRRVKASIVEPTKLRSILIEELAKHGATIEYEQNSKFKVTFNNDPDYTAFVLRWS